MKRLTLLTILLVVVGLTAGFALELKPTFTLSGSATLTWGIDLDLMQTGFTNAGSADFTVTLFPDSSDAHTGKGDIHGSITISHLTLYWIDGVLYLGDDVKTTPSTTTTEASVAAQLFIGPLEIGINGAPSMSSDSAVEIETDSGNDQSGHAIIDAVLEDDTSFYLSRYSSGQQGTYVKYAATDWWAKADIVSQGTRTANIYAGYAFGLEGSMTFAPVTVGAGLFQGINWTLAAGWPSNPLGGYLKTSVAIPSVGPAAVGFDWQLDGTTFTWEISGSAQMNFNKDATAYFLAKVFYDPQGVNGLDSALILMIPADTLLGKINFDIYGWLLDLDLPTADLALSVDAGYKMALQGDMYVQPILNVNFAYANMTTASLQIVPSVVIGLAAAPATTLTFAYTSGDLLLATPGLGSITAALGVTY